MKKVYLITFLIILIDQLSKFYIKTNFYLGEDVEVFSWFKLAFVENPGMAYGMSFGGITGKIALTVFRVLLIGSITYYIYKWSKRITNNYFLISTALVLAGAVGNVIDCAFYGVIFDSGTTWNDAIGWVGYQGLSKANFSGYSPFLTGCVVDMLYFPLFDFYWPNWIPVVGGNHFVFFQPVFNIADTSISIGGFILFIFRRKAFLTNDGKILKL